jgi:hypothetical protein
MPSIDVDFEVFKLLTMKRPFESFTENDVLRELLGLPAKATAGGQVKPAPSAGAWTAKGVKFPSGTDFRAVYKGETHLGKVENGALVINGTKYDSPSAAAMAITQSPVNGWTFWECRLPGTSKWTQIKALRG